MEPCSTMPEQTRMTRYAIQKKIYADSLTKLKKSERLWSAKKKFCRSLQHDGSKVQMLHNVFHARSRNTPGYLSRDCRTWRCRFKDGDAAGHSASLTGYEVSELAPETRRSSGAMARRNALCSKARQPHDSQMPPSVRFSRHHDCSPEFLLGESVPAPEPFI